MGCFIATVGEKGDNATTTNLQWPMFDFESQVLKHASLKMLMLAIGSRRVEMPSRIGVKYEPTDEVIVKAAEEVRSYWNDHSNLEVLISGLFSYNSRKFSRIDRKRQQIAEQKAEELAADEAKHERLIKEQYENTLTKKASRINPERTVKNNKT